MKRLTILLAALGALLLLTAAPAFGAEELTEKETFGSAEQPSFTKAASVAVVKSTGDLLVLDTEAGTVSRYHEDGTASNFSALGSNVISGFSFGAPSEVQVAVDNSGGATSGDIYVVTGSGGVQMFDKNGNSLGELTESSEGAFAFPCGVAVDPSGNLYVNDYSGAIHKYEPSGAFPVKADNSANFPFSEGCLIAAGAGATEGFIFSSHYLKSTVKLDSTTGAEKYEVDPGVEEAFGPSVNPTNGHVFIPIGEKVHEYDASGAGSATEVASTATPTLPGGILGTAANGKAHNLYATQINNPNVLVFSLPTATGPTNLRTLTVTKNANGPGGTGSVSSKPKGIKCGATCSEAVAAMYKSTPVELTAKPATGSAFVKWENAKEGGSCDGSTNPICTVPMAEDEALEAVFSGASKTIVPAEPLTLSKEGSGKGTVKAAGLGCEAECTQTTVLYQGPITEPKAKPGKVVILKQAPAFGSTFSGWSGCDTETEAGECVVEMDEAHTVEAEYAALPNKSLTVDKAYATGNGSVASKPKGIKCGTTCTQAVAQMPEEAKVELVAKPGTETAFVKWVGGDCEGSTNPVCVVTMNGDETTEAVFSKAGKAFLSGSEPSLTLSKAGSGFGTVKAAGLACEVLCSSTTVLYQGPITEPKAKPGKVVILKAASAPGSKPVEWTGCDTVTEAGECVVEMDEDHTVSASFEELE